MDATITILIPQEMPLDTERHGSFPFASLSAFDLIDEGDGWSADLGLPDGKRLHMRHYWNDANNDEFDLWAANGRETVFLDLEDAILAATDGSEWSALDLRDGCADIAQSEF